VVLLDAGVGVDAGATDESRVPVGNVSIEVEETRTSPQGSR